MTGDELRTLRKKLHLTQEEIGEKLGITKDAVYAIECGKNKMSRPVEILAMQLHAAQGGDKQ
jgi:transcriptional regulator with XRE-family HTH domain